MSEVKAINKKKVKKEERFDLTEYKNEVSVIEQKYNDEVIMPADKFRNYSTEAVPKLETILKGLKDADGLTMSDEDVRNQIVSDCRHFWKTETIYQSFSPELKRDYDNPQLESPTAGTDSESLEESASTEDPQEALIKKLKTDMKYKDQTINNLQKGFDKYTKQNEKLLKQIEDQKKTLKEFNEQSKELKANSGLLDIVLDLYDKKLGALEINVTGTSVQTLREFAEKLIADEDKDNVKLVIKITGKKPILDSIS